jgi:hypothetical protein
MKVIVLRSVTVLAAASALGTAFVPAAAAAKARVIAPSPSIGTVCVDGFQACAPAPILLSQ